MGKKHKFTECPKKGPMKKGDKCESPDKPKKDNNKDKNKKDKE
jgi:hypothetical protein